MPSIHSWKAIEKARASGGFSGDEGAVPLWDLSKREILEVALRLGALNAGRSDSADAGVATFHGELAALRANGIL